MPSCKISSKLAKRFLRYHNFFYFKDGHHQPSWILKLNSAINAAISSTILVKIGPVVSEENMSIEIALLVHDVVRRISLNISGCNGPIFTIFSPYENNLNADDQAVLDFPICQGTLPW